MFVSSDQTSGEFRKIVVSIRILTNVFGLFQTQGRSHKLITIFLADFIYFFLLYRGSGSGSDDMDPQNQLKGTWQSV